MDDGQSDGHVLLLHALARLFSGYFQATVGFPSDDSWSGLLANVMGDRGEGAGRSVAAWDV